MERRVADATMARMEERPAGERIEAAQPGERIRPHPSPLRLWGFLVTILGGTLLGIGSLQLQRETQGGRREDLNMIVPIDLLKPVLNDLLTLGRPNRPPRNRCGRRNRSTGPKPSRAKPPR